MLMVWCREITFTFLRDSNTEEVACPVVRQLGQADVKIIDSRDAPKGTLNLSIFNSRIVLQSRNSVLLFFVK